MAPELKNEVEAPAPKAKKAPKAKAAKKAPKVIAQFGVERDHDLPWNEKKIAVFKAMKKMGAFSATAAKGSKEIAEKANLTERDVRHYVYHAKAAGLTGVAVVEGQRGYSFYLTAKGQKVDPSAEAKAQRKE